MDSTGKFQVPTTVQGIEDALKAKYDAMITENNPERDGLTEINKENIKIHPDAIEITTDGIKIKGKFFSEDAYKVAKGAKKSKYNEVFNITVLDSTVISNQSTPNTKKLAKLQISKDGSVEIIKFN